jgi:endonuclease III
VVDDAQSKVTLRPRSKLERVLDGIDDEYDVPPRPALDLVSQAALLRLVACGADSKTVLGAIAPLCAETGSVDPERLAKTPRELVASFCPDGQVDEVVRALRALGEAAGASPRGLEAICRGDLAEARRRLRTLPGIGEQHADLLLLQAGLHAVVAPTGYAVQVAARLGYPGGSYASFARALDEELPEHANAIAVAWRAHHLLDQHGKGICAPKAPECGRCPIREACAYRGEGEDPATRLSWRAPALV